MLITLEGIEGSGKTTQINFIAGYLRELGHDCVITKEPGGTKIGEKIRSILLDPENKGIHPMTELMLYAADRVQHIKEFINPMLDAKKIVICDRFHDSTTVYQGFTRGLDVSLICQLNTLILEGVSPDITFVLDLPAELGLERAWKQINNGARSDKETRFENEKLSFHKKVRNGYLEIAQREPQRFVIIDASVEAPIVRKSILEKLKEFLKNYTS